MEIGFIGFGYLGKAIIERLISQKVKVEIWNRSLEKIEKEYKVVKHPKELAQKFEFIGLCLSDSSAVREVLTSENLLKGSVKGKTIIDFTTNSYPEVIEFYEVLKKEGANYLESPVIGSIVPAKEGKLILLVSGEKEIFERAKPFLEKISQKIFYFSSPGKATQAKLINNYVFACFLTTLSSAIVLGEKAGFSKEQILEILASGAGNSTVLNAKKEKLIKEDFSTHFSVKNMIKDLFYFDKLLKEIKGISFEADLAKEIFKLAQIKGYQEKDVSVIYQIFKMLNS